MSGPGRVPSWLRGISRLAEYRPLADLLHSSLPVHGQPSFRGDAVLGPTFAVTHEIATAVSLAAVSLVLTALLSIVALVGGGIVRRLQGTAQRRR